MKCHLSKSVSQLQILCAAPEDSKKEDLVDSWEDHVDATREHVSCFSGNLLVRNELHSY